MRQRSPLSFLVVGIVLLLLIGISGCNKSPLNLVGRSETPTQPTAAIFVSKQSPVMVSMLVNPEQLSALPWSKDLSKLKTSLLTNTSIDYKKDIQPWLGNEITLAVTSLDVDRDPANGLQPGYLMALATAQPEKSREFVDLFFSKRVLAGANLAIEQYEGVKLIYENQQETFPSKNSISSTSTKKKGEQIQNHLAGAVVGDRFVLFANEPKVLREAINNVQAVDLNLTSSPQYQQATKQLPKSSLAVAFLNLAKVAQWQGLDLSDYIYDSQILSLIGDSKGLLAETTFITKKETLPPSAELSKPVEALQYLPASASLAISGSDLSNLNESNLAQLWTQATTAIFGSKEDVAAKWLQPLAEIQQRLGINWKNDIFNWVTGEYALGLLSREAQTNPDWIFVAEKSDATPLGISHLDQIATSRGLSLNSINLDGQKIYAWTEITTTPTTSANKKDQASFTIDAKVQGVHTTLGKYEVIASSIEAIDQVLKNKENSLPNNKNFQASIAAIPQPNQGYVYLDWTNSQQILERHLPILKLVEFVGKPFFQNLRSLTVSSYGNDTKMLKAGVFFQLASH
jgi:hypothetical protein